MDNAEVERALEDLDSRLERLRALYEQYFMGIEKLEPLVVRKDFDRRVMLIRREQVRNTALRFKFQTIVQRYNTFQQYWARVAREIDNGTYHRDVARAAARFGSKDALTILGKRQAEKYTRLLQNQDARRARSKAPYTLDEDVVLTDDDLLADEPDAPEELDEIVADDDLEIATPEPPPVKPPAPPPPPGRASIPPPPPPMAPTAPTTAPVAGKQGPPLPPPLGTRGAPPLPPPKQAPAATPEPPAAKPADAPRKPEPLNPMMMMRRAEAPAVQKAPEAAAPADAPPAAAKPAGGDADASKRRVAALASQVKQPKVAAGPTSARPLDLDFELDGKTSPASRRRPSSTRMRAVTTPAADEPAPSVPSPSSRRRSSRSMRAVTISTPPEPPKEAKETRPATPETPAESPEPQERAVTNPRPAAQKPRPQPSAASHEESLSDARVRQIYVQYVEAKRAAKESTAGVTYEALAKQLRQQAEKLKATHPQKSVDYNVVMKDGKPTLKPILR